MTGLRRRNGGRMMNNSNVVSGRVNGMTTVSATDTICGNVEHISPVAKR
jgi:hypothetical protein